MGMTALLLAPLIMPPISWSGVASQIEGCQTFQEISRLQDRLMKDGSRNARVGAAICGYYMNQYVGSAPLPNKQSINPSTLIVEATKKSPTAEELVWRWKICLDLSEPDVPPMEPVKTGEANVGGRLVGVYTSPESKAHKQRLRDIRGLLVRQFPESIQAKYIDALMDDDPLQSFNHLRPLVKSTQLWRYDALWSMNLRVPRTHRPELGDQVVNLIGTLDHRSFIFKARFQS